MESIRLWSVANLFSFSLFNDEVHDASNHHNKDDGAANDNNYFLEVKGCTDCHFSSITVWSYGVPI